MQEEASGGGGEEESDYFPEKILKGRLKPGQRAECREYLVKWRGWSDAEEDLTWKGHSELAVSNPSLVWNYVQGVRRSGRSLKINQPNDEQLEAAARAEAGEAAAAVGQRQRRRRRRRCVRRSRPSKLWTVRCCSSC